MWQRQQLRSGLILILLFTSVQVLFPPRLASASTYDNVTLRGKAEPSSTHHNL